MRNIEQNITSDFYSNYKPRRNIIIKQNKVRSQNSLMDLTMKFMKTNYSNFKIILLGIKVYLKSKKI